MKTKRSFIALIGVALFASAVVVGCSKESGKESEKELLKQSLRTFVCLDDVDINTTETTTVSAEVFEETLGSYLKTFSGKAYIAVNINQESSDYYDITLIPMASDHGKAISKSLNGLSGAEMTAFSSKDKDKLGQPTAERG